MIPVPVTARETVWSPVTAALAVAVTVIAVVPASVPVLALTERLTLGSATTLPGAMATPRKEVLGAVAVPTMALASSVGVALMEAL